MTRQPCPRAFFGGTYFPPESRGNVPGLNEMLPQVAGGQRIYSELGEVSYLKVGPWKVNKAKVMIISHEGPPVTYNGLLGMNFLKHFQYNINYKNVRQEKDYFMCKYDILFYMSTENGHLFNNFFKMINDNLNMPLLYKIFCNNISYIVDNIFNTTKWKLLCENDSKDKYINPSLNFNKIISEYEINLLNNLMN